MLKEKLDHAEHNREVCLHLSSSKKYPDWTITTAFYAMIYYCEAILFPLTEDGVEYKNLSIYSHKQNLALHPARMRAVQKHLKSFIPEYVSLADACRTARYSDYKAYSHLDSLEFIKRMEKFRRKALSE
ncbi:MAG: hypothetical protein JW928_08525 [Candidatus Aureabacteria bacterium]|nr:hypothetical protein [Candidatus Auribacterota bacterium]